MPVLNAVLVFLVTVLAGCTAPCNPSSVCAVIGSPPNQQVCNGRHYSVCDDNSRGETIGCVSKPQRAVCSPSGWAFEAAPPAGDGGQP
jgi:hypothetical protein